MQDRMPIIPQLKKIIKKKVPTSRVGDRETDYY